MVLDLLTIFDAPSFPLPPGILSLSDAILSWNYQAGGAWEVSRSAACLQSKLPWNHQEQGPPSSAQRRSLSVSSLWSPCIWAAFGSYSFAVLQTHSLLVSSESVLGYSKLLSYLWKQLLGWGHAHGHLLWEALPVSSLINHQVSTHASCLTLPHLSSAFPSPYCSASPN